MKKFMKSLLFIAVFVMAVLPAFSAEESVYQTVKSALDKFDHRVPGSPEYYRSIDSLEKILTDNGISVHRQVYQTYVPKDTKLVFRINGKDVKIRALSPNNLSLITTGEKEINADLIYLPPSQLYESYGNVGGKIAVLEWGENYYPKTLFTENAKAVIFVGNDKATQWDVQKLLNQYNISFPYFYISREEAEANGMLKPYDASKPLHAVLSYNSQWETVDGINLWAEIKGKNLKTFELGDPEAVIIGARMDTFGVVPGLVRSERLTSNLALISQIAVDLSKQSDLNRSFFLVLYGSSYNCYDGLRNFYFPYYKRNAKTTPTLDDYLDGYKVELNDVLEQIDAIEHNPVRQDEDTQHYTVRLLLRDAIVKRYNLLNHELGDVNVKMRKQKAALAQAADEAEKAVLEKEIQEKELIIRDYEPYKIAISNLRKDINERKIDESRQELFDSEFVTSVKKDLYARKKELESTLKLSSTWHEIADTMRPYQFIGAYFFDFSNDDQPFIFATRSYQQPNMSAEMSISVYSKYFSTLKELLPSLKMQKGPTPILEDSIRIGFTPDNLSSRSLLYLPNTVGLVTKLAGFSMRNVPGSYDYDEIPCNREYRLSGLIPAMNEFFRTVGTAEEFSSYSMIPDATVQDAYFNYYYKNGKHHGTMYSILGGDGKELEGPASGQFAFQMPNDYDRVPTICGFSQIAFSMINHSGYLSMPLVAIGNQWNITTPNQVVAGSIGFDEVGRVNMISTSASYNKLFRCFGGTHIFEYAPLTSNYCAPLNVLNGLTDQAFKNYHGGHRVATNEGYLYIDKKEIPAKLYWYQETFVLGEISKEYPVGRGFSIEPENLLNLNTSWWGIRNTIQLNKDRIEKLHKRNIFNSVVESYQDTAEQHMAASLVQRAKGNLNKARAHEIFGYTLAIRAYRPLKNMINDLVSSVLVLLILTIPFAFALERLIIGATNVYKQLAWVMVFFVQTFLILYFTHPAFALSQAPMIIFIAFFIIVMSVVVIYIVMNRFKTELMAMQGLDTAAHRVNSENSMLLAAIMIGVSSMRNRPVKTFLTILTVVLLTFTIISFASIESTGYVRPTYIGDGSGELRIEYFLAQHVDLLRTTVQAVRDIYDKDYDVVYRSASYSNPFYNYKTYPNQTNLLYNQRTGKAFELEAIVGFEEKEYECCDKVRKLLPDLTKNCVNGVYKDGIPGVYISGTAAEEMDLKVGDCFYIRNVKVRLDGVFKAADLDSFSYLDGGKVSPPNYQATASAEELDIWSIYRNADVDSSNSIWSSPDMTVLTDYETAVSLNGFINAMVLYPKKDKNPDMIADSTHIAEMIFGLVYSNTVNGVNRHYFTEGYQASGLSNLIVPLLLGALIILSSLLGSIADREREIFTFSALGLSPKDVSVLFFAESGVYAVIGGLGGYLLSQATTAVLNALSKRGLLEAPEMNYSSMSTVYTILTVMAIVLLSTVYPAVKAGRSASPDVARKWKMPPPEGDKLSFQFPFTVSRIDFGGILVFISEHFANHSDSSLGSFAAANVKITHGDSPYTDGYQLFAELTLAPFDLGVAEEFYMYSAPSDIEGVDVVTCTINRKDGSKGAWMRGNRRFVDEIRNQFLLWRSLPVETVLHYRGIAAAKLNNTEEKGV